MEMGFFLLSNDQNSMGHFRHAKIIGPFEALAKAMCGIVPNKHFCIILMFFCGKSF
jgi:hypothetical protein